MQRPWRKSIWMLAFSVLTSALLERASSPITPMAPMNNQIQPKIRLISEKVCVLMMSLLGEKVKGQNQKQDVILSLLDPFVNTKKAPPMAGLNSSICF